MQPRQQLYVRPTHTRVEQCACVSLRCPLLLAPRTRASPPAADRDGNSSPPPPRSRRPDQHFRCLPACADTQCREHHGEHAVEGVDRVQGVQGQSGAVTACSQAHPRMQTTGTRQAKNPPQSTRVAHFVGRCTLVQDRGARGRGMVHLLAAPRKWMRNEIGTLQQAML